MDSNIHELAEGTFLARKEALRRNLFKGLADQVQDHLKRGLLSSTVWLNARRETRREYLRQTLKDRVDTLADSYETAGRTLDRDAEAFLHDEINAICRAWEGSEERETVERLCRLACSEQHRQAVHADMIGEQRAATTYMRSLFARHKLIAKRQQDQRPWSALDYLQPQTRFEDMKQLQGLMTERVALIKANGTRVRDGIRAAVDAGKSQIITLDVQLPIEANDFFERILPNGMAERFVIEDPGYQAGVGGIPAFFQARVRRTTTPPPSQPSITYSVSGPNSRINIQSDDKSANATIVSQDTWSSIQAAIDRIEGASDRQRLTDALGRVAKSSDSSTFAKAYGEFVVLAANHMTILAPFIPQLFSLGPT